MRVHPGDGLGEINPYTMIVNQDVLHFEVGLLCIFSFIKLNERIL